MSNNHQDHPIMGVDFALVAARMIGALIIISGNIFILWRENRKIRNDTKTG